MNKLNNISIMSASKFVFAILAVADKLATIVSYPCRPRVPECVVKSDGDRSFRRVTKSGLYCGDTIPANRLNRKTRRNLVRKVSANKPQVITVKA